MRINPIEPLQPYIDEYIRQLNKGQIQKAYRGIMAFMSGLKTYLENGYPDFITGGLYFGYMDMTYFPFTPPDLSQRKLKIAIVYLHEKGKFEAWLSGTNKKIQAELIQRLSQKDIGDYLLSESRPGVDSIIETTLVDRPDFNDPEKIKTTIEQKTLDFIKDIVELLEEHQRS